MTLTGNKVITLRKFTSKGAAEKGIHPLINIFHSILYDRQEYYKISFEIPFVSSYRGLRGRTNYIQFNLNEIMC